MNMPASPQPIQERFLVFKRVVIITLVAVGATLTIPVLIVAIGIASLLWNIMQPQDTTKDRTTMTTYLHNKYGEDFTVGQIKANGYGLGVEGWMEGTAYPKKDASLTFKVTTSSHGQSDTYQNAIWKRQASPSIEQHLREIFGYKPSYNLNVGINTGKNTTPAPSGIPPIWSKIVANKDYPTYYDLTVNISQPSLSTTTVKTHEAKAKQVFQFVHAQGTTTFEADYSIKSKTITEHSLKYYLSVGASPSSIACNEGVSTTEKNYAAAMSSDSLEAFYAKSCSYKLNGNYGFGVEPGTYPGTAPKSNFKEVNL